MSTASVVQNLHLRYFDPRSMKYNKFEKHGPIIVIVGRRGCGKSFLLKDIMWHFRDVPNVFVISGSEECNPFFGDFVPPRFIQYEYHSAYIEEIRRRQTKEIAAFERSVTENGQANTTMDPRIIVVLDDCLFDGVWTRDTQMKYIFLNGRHSKIMLIVTMQYPLGIPPMLRGNIDYAFIFKEYIDGNRKRIYANYGSACFPNYQTFCAVLDQTTQNNECLVIDSTTQTNDLSQVISCYKAKPHANFRMCHPRHWEAPKPNEIHNRRGVDYRPDLNQQKNQSQIRVYRH